MTLLPIILEQRPPGPMTVDESGRHALRRFSVLTSSQVAAINLMVNNGVYRGSVYVDPSGNVPDPYLLCQRLTSVGKPEAPRGGVGNYIVDVEYADIPLAPLVAKPGGGVIWWVRGALTSTPVDIDADGAAILMSSGEAVDPALTALLPDEVLHGEFYVKAPDALTAYFPFRKYNGTINDRPLPRLGALMGELLCHPFIPEPSDLGWVKMSVDFQYRPSKTLNTLNGKTVFPGWFDVFPDRSKRRVKSTTSDSTALSQAYEVMLDTAGNGQDGVLMNGSGGELTYGQRNTPFLWSKKLNGFSNFSTIPFP